MTETRTTRFNLPQWSTGEDEAGSWQDFTGAFADIEARAAIDRLAPASALPSSGVVPAEYFLRTTTIGASTLRSLYRGDSGGTLRALNWAPETLRVRPADTVASTAEGLRVDHPDVTLPALTTTWDGKATVRDSLVLGAASDTALGRLAVGGLDAVPAGVRARITAAGAERALELRAGNSSVTELLRAVDSAGSNVLSISGSGSLTSTQAAAFGATSPGAASLTGAPQPSGAQAAGILAYGLEAATSRAALQINRYGPGSSDPAAILSVLPSSITVGRTGTWTGATLTLGAPTVAVRADKLAWYPTVADMAEPNGAATAGMATGSGLYSTIGTQLSNAGVTSGSANNLFSYPSGAGSWTGQLMRAFQTEIGGSPESVEVMRLDGAGRLSLNAPWRGSGTRPAELRDARQPVMHYSNRIWATPGTYEAGPQLLGGGSAFTYTWPSMTVRSASATQLYVTCRLEAQFFRNTGNDTPIERQTMQLQWFLSIDGGTFNLVLQNQISDNLPSAQEQGTLVSGSWSDSALTQDTLSIPVLSTIPAGSTFRLRLWAAVATGSDAADAIAPAYARLRRADLYVRETIIQTYAAS